MSDSSNKNDKEIDFVLYDLFENILKVCLNPLIDDNINESNKPTINQLRKPITSIVTNSTHFERCYSHIIHHTH